MTNSIRYLRSRPGRFAWLGMVGLWAMLATVNMVSAQVTYLQATTPIALKAARGPDATEINSTTWVDLPGATLKFTVPAKQTNVFNARYTAESVCYGGPGWCSVRILMNGVETAPVVGIDFAFDSTSDGTASSEGWKGHAVDRSKIVTNNGTAPVTVTVLVQYSVTDSSINFRLDDWQFTVEQFKQ
jgi:hypothetical protein